MCITVDKILFESVVPILISTLATQPCIFDYEVQFCSFKILWSPSRSGWSIRNIYLTEDMLSLSLHHYIILSLILDFVEIYLGKIQLDCSDNTEAFRAIFSYIQLLECIELPSVTISNLKMWHRINEAYEITHINWYPVFRNVILRSLKSVSI